MRRSFISKMSIIRLFWRMWSNTFTSKTF